MARLSGTMFPFLLADDSDDIIGLRAPSNDDHTFAYSGDENTFSAQQTFSGGLVLQTVTKADLEDEASAINTIDKVAGKLVFDATESKLYVATGPNASDDWEANPPVIYGTNWATLLAASANDIAVNAAPYVTQTSVTNQTTNLFTAMTAAGATGLVYVTKPGAYKFDDATAPNTARICLGPGVTLSNPTGFNPGALFHPASASVEFMTLGYTPLAATGKTDFKTYHNEFRQNHHYAARAFQRSALANTTSIAFMDAWTLYDDITKESGGPTFPTTVFSGVQHNEYYRGLVSEATGVGILRMDKVFIGKMTGSNSASSDTRTGEGTINYWTLQCHPTMENGGQSYWGLEASMLLPELSPARAAIGVNFVMINPVAKATMNASTEYRGLGIMSLITTSGWGLQAAGDYDFSGKTSHTLDYGLNIGGFCGTQGTVASGDHASATDAFDRVLWIGGNGTPFNRKDGSNFWTSRYRDGIEIQYARRYGIYINTAHSAADSSSRSILIASSAAEVQFQVTTTLRALKFETDNTYNIGESSDKRPAGIYAASLVQSGGNVVAGASSSFILDGRSKLNSTADGFARFQNNAGSGFTALQLGGATSSFPSIRVSGAIMQAYLADQTGFTRIQGIIRTHANAVAETPAATHTIAIEDASGTAYKVLALAV